MKFLLDTNIVVLLYDKRLENRHPKVYEKFSNLAEEDNIYVSVLTLYELEYGICNVDISRQKPFRLMLDRVKAELKTLPLSEKGARIYGELKSRLKEVRNTSSENVKKHNIDVMLASVLLQ